jgi:hypothetical protein
VGLTAALTECLEDERQPGKIRHEMSELLFSKRCVKRGTGNRRTLLEPYFLERRYGLCRQVLEARQLAATPIDYLEFGVYKGESLHLWTEHVQHPDSEFSDFDCFTGLPSDWGDKSAGTLSTEGKRRISETRDVASGSGCLAKHSSRSSAASRRTDRLLFIWMQIFIHPHSTC